MCACSCAACRSPSLKSVETRRSRRVSSALSTGSWQSWRARGEVSLRVGADGDADGDAARSSIAAFVGGDRIVNYLDRGSR